MKAIDELRSEVQRAIERFERRTNWLVQDIEADHLMQDGGQFVRREVQNITVTLERKA